MIRVLLKFEAKVALIFGAGKAHLLLYVLRACSVTAGALNLDFLHGHQLFCHNHCYLLSSIVCVFKEVKREHKNEPSSPGGGSTFLQGGVLDPGRAGEPKPSILSVPAGTGDLQGASYF